jgi:dihydrofolate reductase
MRKLVISMNITLDGYVEGDRGELDWHLKLWSDDMARYSTALLAAADTLLFGRMTFLQMQAYWKKKLGDATLPREDEAFADILFNYRKVVFSNTLKKTTWNNSEVCVGDLKETISAMKKQSGKNLLTVGSGQLSRSILYEGITDELVLWIHPVLLGRGKLFFTRERLLPRLQLADYRIFSSGVIAVKYRLSATENDGTEFASSNNETGLKSLIALHEAT